MRMRVVAAVVGLVWATAMGAPPALAAPPVLEEAEPVPTHLLAGAQYSFRIRYRDADGDSPRSITCVVSGPGGTQRKDYDKKAGDNAKQGITAEFTMGPLQEGQYNLHFTAQSGDGTAQTNPVQFVVENITHKYVQLGVGELVCLLFVPAILFFFMRMLSSRGDPRRAARFGLLVGIVLGYSWYVYLFSALHPTVAVVMGGIVALAAVVALFGGSRRTEQS